MKTSVSATIDATALAQHRAAQNRLNRMSEGFVNFERLELEQSIPQRFEKQVLAHGERIAIRAGGHQFTYRELNYLANGIASAILALGGTKEEPVAVLVDHNPAAVGAVLGILKSGNFYVPMDPTYPHHRLSYMLEDSQTRLIVVDNQSLDIGHQLAKSAIQILNVDEIDAQPPVENIGTPISPNAVAYVIYTSGSTGQPKGVIHTHRNVLHFMMKRINSLRLNPNDRVSALSSLSHSASVSDIFGTLLCGAGMFLYDVKQDGLAGMAKWLIEDQITVLDTIPTLFREYSLTLRGESFPSVRLIRLSGEAALRRDVDQYNRDFSDHCVLVNWIGCTEFLGMCHFLVDKNTVLNGSVVPGGFPLDDVEFELVDQDGKVRHGDGFGEIVIKSEFLSPGYWRKPEKTNSVFLAGPKAGDRRYLTGDLGRLLPDGCLLHLGRKDTQVKIRGQRVELAELEGALLELPLVKNACASAWKAEGEVDSLVAYVVPENEELTTDAIRSALSIKLPASLMPRFLVFLDSLPLTPSGKIDRLSLPDPDHQRPLLSQSYVPPSTKLEAQLVEVWQSVLQLTPIGVKDDFFELGGDSLQSLGLLIEIERVCARSFPPSMLLEYRTIELMARAIEHYETAPTLSCIVPLRASGSRPPLFLMHFNGVELMVYRPLTDHMGANQPVYGIQPFGLGDGQVPFTSIEEMATHYVAEIRIKQPSGPYYLAGYSAGGIWALEVAQQLIRAGEEVALLALFDTGITRFAQLSRLWQRIPRHFQIVWELGWDQKPAYLRLRATGMGKRIRGMTRGFIYPYPSKTKNHPSIKTDRIENALIFAYYAYRVREYRGKITLFRAEGRLWNLQGIDPRDGWKVIAKGGLTVIDVPGSHLEMLSEPYVQVVAERLTEAIDRASGKVTSGSR